MNIENQSAKKEKNLVLASQEAEILLLEGILTAYGRGKQNKMKNTNKCPGDSYLLSTLEGVDLPAPPVYFRMKIAVVMPEYFHTTELISISHWSCVNPQREC